MKIVEIGKDDALLVEMKQNEYQHICFLQEEDYKNRLFIQARKPTKEEQDKLIAKLKENYFIQPASKVVGENEQYSISELKETSQTLGLLWAKVINEEKIEPSKQTLRVLLIANDIVKKEMEKHLNTQINVDNFNDFIERGKENEIY